MLLFLSPYNDVDFPTNGNEQMNLHLHCTSVQIVRIFVCFTCSFTLQKPGFCPHRHWDFEHCGDLCSCDGDCPNNEKCCSTGCGHMCMAPVLDDCPRHLNLALARKGCEDCPRDHICCVCLGEEVCVPPVSKKPGVCPRRCLDFGNCAESCSCDSDCSDHEKCCSNGCGHECMPAVIGER
uniref:WAP four-disulfide core domain 2 n=1 Tax=Amphilophus citrinellus TaxID=61819 RepID=A0A3Q0SXY9_AMPCI